MMQHVEVHGAFAIDIDETYKTQVDTTILQAKVTKTMGCLLHLYVQGTSTQELRPQVQKEIKSLRALGLKEKEIFPKALHNKVQATLSMKG
eukprot:6490745-Amphidinium_carterae.1